MNKVAVLNAVGLTPSLISVADTPRLAAFRDAGKLAAVGPVLPAVTTAVQTTYLTGAWPAEHGIVGNGWYDRHGAEVQFWKQADGLVQRPRIWELAKRIDPAATTANVCWWYAMYSGADYTVTPRPMYPADGRKLPDCWTHPPELRDELAGRAGAVPAVQVLGADDGRVGHAVDRRRGDRDRPQGTTRRCRWSTCRTWTTPCSGGGRTTRRTRSTWPSLDAVCGSLIDHYHERGARVVILSEYGIAAGRTGRST